jgi:hypothetical protein
MDLLIYYFIPSDLNDEISKKTKSQQWCSREIKAKKDNYSFKCNLESTWIEPLTPTRLHIAKKLNEFPSIFVHRCISQLPPSAYVHDGGWREVNWKYSINTFAMLIIIN